MIVDIFNLPDKYNSNACATGTPGTRISRYQTVGNGKSGYQHRKAPYRENTQWLFFDLLPSFLPRGHLTALMPCVLMPCYPDLLVL
jgi:hypothetical protein